MPKIVRIYENGGPEVLRFDEEIIPAPGPQEITIDVKALGINRSEVMFRLGRHIEPIVVPARLGYEAAGFVHAIGHEVQHVKVGDPVSVIPPPSVTRWGAYGERVTFPATHVVRNPASLSMNEAAGLWMQSITAYGGMVDLGKLKAGQTVVIIAASSSVGLAAIQIAKLIGARVIATTRGSEKRQALLDFGADHVVVTQEQDLKSEVLRLTQGIGAELIFDPIAGPYVADLAEATAKLGTIILYGFIDPNPTPYPLFTCIARGINFRGFTFKEIVLDNERRARARDFVLNAVEKGKLRPVLDRIFQFKDIAQAHAYLETNQHFGKIVVEV